MERKLLDIPIELLTRIALTLDLASARSLALTCKALREPAETCIWRDVTIAAKYPGGTHRYQANPPSFNDRWGLLPDELYARARSPASRLLRLSTALSTTLWRSHALRSIHLDLHPEIPGEVVSLLRHAPSLSALSLKVKPSDMLVLPAKGLISTVQLFESLSLPTLKRAVLDIQHLYPRTISALLHAAPNLKSLDLTLYPQYLLELPLADDDASKRPVVLPNSNRLHTLIVNPRTSDIPLLTEIVRSSPGLRNVALRDDGQSWKPQAHVDFWDALGRCEIERLEVTSRALGMITADRFPNVKHLQVAWPAKALRDILETPELIPVLPSLEAYHVDILCAARPQDDFTLYTFHDRVFLANLWLPHMENLNMAVHASLSSRIHHLPKLHTITLPDAPSLRRKNGSQVAEGRMWSNEEFHWWVIQSYRNEQGEELCHLTALAPWKLCDGDAGTNERLDSGRFQGEEIPLSVLKAMYAAVGKDMRKVVPGRGQALGPEGWAVFRQWRMGNY